MNARIRRSAVAVVAAAVLPLSLAACSDDGDSGSSDSAQAASSAPAATDDQSADASGGMAGSDEPFGPACSTVPKEGAGSFDGMAKDPVATAASNNPALSTLVSAVKKAMDQGVVVINIDNRLDPDLLKSKGISVPFVGPDNRKGARLVGDYLASQKLKAGDQVGIIEGVSTTTNAQQRTAGFKDAMDAAQMKIVSVQSGNWEIDKGNAVAASMLNEYPDLKALLAGNDSMALGAVSAVRAAGKTGQVQVVGYDNINAIKPMLEDGRVLATLDQAASQQAVYGIQAALKMVKGEKPDVDADNVIQTPVELITKKP